MPNDVPPEPYGPYLVLKKAVFAQTADEAWEKYQRQLEQLHARSQDESVRQQGAWNAYKELLQQGRANMFRSQSAASPPHFVLSGAQ